MLLMQMFCGEKGLGFRGQLQCTLHKSEERWTVEFSFSGSDVPFYMLTLNICSAIICMGGWKMPFEVCHLLWTPMFFRIWTYRWQDIAVHNQITCESVWSVSSELSVPSSHTSYNYKLGLFHFQTGLAHQRYKVNTIIHYPQIAE